VYSVQRRVKKKEDRRQNKIATRNVYLVDLNLVFSFDSVGFDSSKPSEELLKQFGSEKSDPYTKHYKKYF